MTWNLKFISEEDLKEHVKMTIVESFNTLESFYLKQIKLSYETNWEQIASYEILKPKGQSNDIGYFYKKIFSYFKNCEVLQDGWDITYTSEVGIEIPECGIVHKIYVKMINMHNIMKTLHSAETYILMQHQLLNEKDCACFLVEAFAENSQNIEWTRRIDGRIIKHSKIRRVSLEQFLQIVTGDENALLKIGLVLPRIIKSLIDADKVLQ